MAMNTYMDFAENDYAYFQHSYNSGYIENHTDCSFSDETKQKLRAVNGYYFSARYPGDESIEVTKSDLDLCNETLVMLRKEVLQMQIKLEKENSLFSGEITEADVAKLKSSNSENNAVTEELVPEKSDDTLPVSEPYKSKKVSDDDSTEGEDEEYDL